MFLFNRGIVLSGIGFYCGHILFFCFSGGSAAQHFAHIRQHGIDVIHGNFGFGNLDIRFFVQRIAAFIHIVRLAVFIQVIRIAVFIHIVRRSRGIQIIRRSRFVYIIRNPVGVNIICRSVFIQIIRHAVRVNVICRSVFIQIIRCAAGIQIICRTVCIKIVRIAVFIRIRLTRGRISGFKIHSGTVFVHIVRIAVFIQVVRRSIGVDIVCRAIFVLISGIRIVINLIAVFVRIRIRPVISRGNITVQFRIVRFPCRISIRSGFGFLHVVSRCFINGRRRFGVSVPPLFVRFLFGCGFCRKRSVRFFQSFRKSGQIHFRNMPLFLFFFFRLFNRRLSIPRRRHNGLFSGVRLTVRLRRRRHARTVRNFDVRFLV